LVEEAEMARRSHSDRRQRRRRVWLLTALLVGAAAWWLVDRPRTHAARVTSRPGGARLFSRSALPVVAAGQATQTPQHAITLHYATHRTLEPEIAFFAEAECSEGHPIEEILYDFGDGATESSIDGKATHRYTYVADPDRQEFAFDTEVRVRCTAGSVAVAHERVTLSNEVGIFAANGIRLLTQDGSALLPDDDGWHGNVTVHNPHDDTLSVADWRVTFERRVTNADGVTSDAHRPRTSPAPLTLPPHATSEVALALSASEVPTDAVSAQFVGSGVASNGSSVRVVVRARLVGTALAGPVQP
jgi:hypothetical protein